MSEAICGASSIRKIEYLSPPAEVSMADRWFEIASLNHFWVRRRFEVFQKLAGENARAAGESAEIGCGHGLLQLQLEQAYGRGVTGFDLNEFALRENVSRLSPIYCYDIRRRDAALEGRFGLIFLFDVLEHIEDEGGFLAAVRFHLAGDGKVAINVPAGQWAYSQYDRAAGHVRRYSIETLRSAAERNRMRVTEWTYWGFPLLPSLALRKLWLAGKNNQDGIISSGFDPRANWINEAMGLLSKCEPIPQKLAGTSLMALLENEPEEASRPAPR